ncbi:MBL fold metallo-hydrolase [Paracoccus sp. NSM]|uniref:MBL fold metallo-hydrolase n=1 Tax=Paracoccus sp. NSM TaxID=3457784 RepID=UPI004036FCDB
MRFVPRLVLTAFLLILPLPLTASEAEDHARAGREAATAFPGFADLCDLNMRLRDVNAPRQRSGGTRPERTGGSLQTTLPPMQVFDNLWFLGNASVSAWLYGSEAGYVLIDTLNTAAEAERDILGGMRSLGLNPAAIRLILVTHAHGDHYGGARFLTQTLGVPVAMSEADWRLAERTPPHPRFGPAPDRDLVLADGQVIPTGQGTLEVMLTPGHTPGTISPLMQLWDGGTAHRALLWGGAGFNFGPNVGLFEEYAASAAMARERARRDGVDVFLSNHVRRDGADRLMEELALRAPSEPHPFVMGAAGLNLFTVLEQCALAQAARLSAPE